MLVFQSLAVPHKPRRRPGRRPGREAEAPASVPVTRVTAVFSDQPFATEDEARRWMRESADDPEARAATLARAVRLINRALHARAVGGQDPYVPQVSPAQAVAARLGHGLGPELAEGNFGEAVAVPTAQPARRRRRDQGLPQDRIAALLSGRERADVCETFLLRARIDLDAGRDREAALGLAIAVESMLVELEGALSDAAHETDLSLLGSRRGDLARIARQARHGALDRADLELCHDLLGLGERILRRRRLLRG